MEMTMTNDMPASLPKSAVMTQNAANSGISGNTLKQSEQRPDSFLKKLSSALEKAESTEANGPKIATKVKPAESSDEKDQTTATGLPVGLVWNLNSNMIPPPAGNAAVQGTVTGIVGQASASQEVAALQETKGQQILPATVLQGQDTKPSLQIPPMPSGIPASPEASTTPPATTTGEASTKPLVMTAITDTSPTELSLSRAVTTGKGVETISPAIPGREAPISVESTMKTEQSVVNTLSTVPVKEVLPQFTNLETNTLDSKLQQSVLSMQSVDTGPTAKTSKMLAADPETDAVPVENEPEPLFGLGQKADGKIVVPTTEGQLPPKALGQTETDLFTSKADKTDSSVMAPVTFDNLLKSVDQVQNTVSLAQPLRQELHEVARQVLDGMSTSADRLKSSQVIITLKPEHLGEVTVKINVDGDKVTAAFHAASSEVRAILENSLPQLRQEMSQQGWKFDSNGVFGGMKDFLANQQQQQQSQAQEQQLPQFSHRTQRDMYEDSTGFTNTGRLQVMTAAAVDYRI